MHGDGGAATEYGHGRKGSGHLKPLTDRNVRAGLIKPPATGLPSQAVNRSFVELDPTCRQRTSTVQFQQHAERERT